MRRHGAHALVFAVVGLGLLLSFSAAYLNYYQQKMSLLLQFERHQVAALVYQTARVTYEAQTAKHVTLTTNLGTAVFYDHADHVSCQVILKDTGYEETFQYMTKINT